MLTAMNTTACTRKDADDQTAQQGCGTAHREPDGDEIQGHGLENDEADGGQQPENGVNRHEFSLLFCPIIEQNV